MLESGVYKIAYRDKVYIGQSKNLSKRGAEHLRQLKNKKHFNVHMQHVFNKYGESDFSFEIIEYCEKSLLDAREIYWIDFYDSYKNGYNQTRGGAGLGYNCKLYKYTYINKGAKKIKLRKVVNLSTGDRFDSVQEVASHYGHKTTSGIAKACSGVGIKYKQCFWCYDYYDIDIEFELSIANQLRSDMCRTDPIKIINYTTGDIFDSIYSAAKFYDINYVLVFNCINGKQSTTHGYEFRKLDDDNKAINNSIKYKKQQRQTDTTARPVINVNTKETYSSITKASRHTGIHASNIAESCSHKRVNAGGYQWEYYSDDVDISSITIRNKNNTYKAKSVINLDTGIVYESASKAAKELGLYYSSILSVCNGKLKTTGGYAFAFYKEE